MTTTARPREFCNRCGHRLFKMEGDVVIIMNGTSRAEYAWNHIVVTCLHPISRTEKCRAVVDITLDNCGSNELT